MVHERLHFVGERVLSISDIPPLRANNTGASTTNDQMRGELVMTKDCLLHHIAVQIEHQQEPQVIDYHNRDLQIGRACETAARRNL